MKTLVRFTHEKIDYSKDNDLHMVVTLDAPKIDWQAKRGAIAVIPAIDVSGSMAGPKLDYAKKSVMKLIDHLQPGDYCGLVTFTTEAQVIFPVTEITQNKKEELKAKVGDLVAQANTNFSGGLLEAFGLVKSADLPDTVSVRIIMFTDGLANTGVAISRQDILALLDAENKASVSAFGYGSDADQELLADLAKKGKGNYAFIQNPDDALSAFAKELGGLLSTYAQNISIDVQPHSAHSITEVVSDVDATSVNSGIVVKLPDILSEEQRHLVFAVTLAKQTQAFPREASVMDIKLEYDMLDENKQKQHRVEEIKGKIEFVKPGKEDKNPNTEVMAIVANAQLVQTQIKAEELAKQGDYAGAAKRLRTSACLFSGSGLKAHAAYATSMAGRIGGASVYMANQGYFQSVRNGVTRAVGSSSLDSDAVGLVSDLCGTTCNSAQASTLQSFADDSNVVSSSVSGPVTTSSSGSSEEKNVPGLEAPLPKKPIKTRSARW